MPNYFSSLLRPLKGSLIALIAILLMSCQFSPVFAQNVRTYIHPRVAPLVPVYKAELQKHFADIPAPWYVLGLTEHESCQYLSHSRCWSATSQFASKWKGTETKKELGAGLAMITKAWNKDGTLRMDTLANLKRAYPQELKDLTWDNISQRADLQILAMILLLKSDYRGLKAVPDPLERLKMTDSAYNGGRRDVERSRKVCGLTKGCDPNVWFGHVAKHCVKSKQALYAGRSPCDINTHHVEDVFHTRMPKFQPILPQL